MYVEAVALCWNEYRGTLEHIRQSDPETHSPNLSPLLCQWGMHSTVKHIVMAQILVVPAEWHVPSC